LEGSDPFMFGKGSDPFVDAISGALRGHAGIAARG
jgi:hypothetical protein